MPLDADNKRRYFYYVRIDFDPAKNASNVADHGLSLEQAARLEWKVAVTKKDNRKDCGEERYITYAPLYGRLCVFVWTPRKGAMRAISFRKANAKEGKRYEKDRQKEKD